MSSPWSEARVRKLLDEEDFGYQRIALPYGLSTGGVDRRMTARRALPDDLRGKSVLDVGAKHGYFCFEAARRGAERVVGIDVDPDSVRVARRLADCLGHDVRFECADVERTLPSGPFDVVLCLNLLHHLRRPVAALDALAGLARERLVLETAGLGRHDRRKLGLSRAGRFFLARAPIVYVSRNGTSGRRSVQKFFVTPPALENLLLHHRRDFARLERFPSEHKDRCVVVAHRRRIGRLVVVAGPTSVGKSTFVDTLLSDRAPEVAARAGVEEPGRWRFCEARALAELDEPRQDRLLLHYDFLRPYLRSAKVHGRDEALDLLEVADEVTFVTLWCDPAELRRRLQRGELDRRTTLGIYWGRRRHARLRDEYRDPERIRAHYRRWLDFTRGVPAAHLVVDVTGVPRCLGEAEYKEWERGLE